MAVESNQLVLFFPLSFLNTSQQCQ